ncbi:diguanylate cyclase [Octadecabacter sp. G9-8]|uniref:diguanylate cyclase n=1 Tax=Octadecabacter dasysiphoniae TaxID=2909341 RepID=A0ABS9CTS6_9RHOB|nr:diguanylate cyclase [Octadecabacter dasysiphoniae]MCF2870640.1 diguanylate cyclase [Octadecabacter dasysiphoniae]
MSDFMKLVSTFVDATALIMALVLVVSILHRTGRTGWFYPILMGGVFSFALVFTMSDPISLGSAGIFDMRGLLIGTAAALFGPVVGVMTLITGLLMRWDIGGPGILPGFVGMIMAYGAGLVWIVMFKKRAFATWKKSVLLGVMITSQMLAIFFAPPDLRGVLFMTLVPYTIVANVLGALLINHLISGELSFLSEAETSKIEANTDHLTGLLNRRGFEMIYPDLADQTGDRRGRALLYFDVDNFKSINDIHGHAVGDDVLRFITDEVGRNLRPHDVFARLGGDEFAIVLSRIDAAEAERIAERCRSVVSDRGFVHKDAALPVSISIGAVWMLEHSEIDQIMDAADTALYAAKTGGRNKVVFKLDRPKRLTLPVTAPT